MDHHLAPKPTRITSKNQVTLPVAAMRKANIRPGSDVIVSAAGPGRITVEAVEDGLDRYLGALRGVWPAGALDELRDEWP